MDGHQRHNKQIFYDDTEDFMLAENNSTFIAPTNFVQQPPSQLSSDVVEVTNVHGGVGFVAVGRVVSYPQDSYIGPYLSEFKPSMDSQHALKQMKESISANKVKHSTVMEKIPRKLNEPIMESSNGRHIAHHKQNSEPLLNSDSDHADAELSLRRFSNTSGIARNERDHLHRHDKQVKSLVNFESNSSKKAHRSKKLCNPQEVTSENGINRQSNKRNRKVNSTLHSTVTRQQDTNLLEEDGKQNTTECNLKKSHSYVHAYPLCKHCGQRHQLTENHEYDYVEETDDDLQCDICLQPFVDPYDTKCGHTFCCICLKNYIRLKKMCPVDRKDLNFSSSDCWQSSLVMRKLVNKLTVHCPNSSFCKDTLPRTDLAAHLKERCPGTVLRCSKAMYGCNFKGPRKEENEHIKNCKFQHLEGNPVESIYPDCVKHVVELFRPEGIAELGIAIIGGNDTPLRNIIIQNIIPGGLVAQDGRIQPGDIIIDVNGEDLHNVGHVEARALLSRSSHLMRFTLLREKPTETFENLPLEGGTYTERIAVSLLKPPSDQLGIKITTCDDSSPGIYILELVEGRVAHANGQLRVGDRVCEISHIDLWNGNPEVAAKIIQNCGERVDIVVSRLISSATSTIMNPWATDKTLPRNTSNKQLQPERKTTLPSSCTLLGTFTPKATYTEKVINVKKSSNESLGIIVAGGTTGARGDLPVFVQDVQPLGVLGKDKRLQRGDLIILVNGIQLNGLSHSQAIAVLKETAQHCREVSLVALELHYPGKDEDFALWEELSGVHHQRGRRGSQKETNCWSSWTPSWKMWLAVPSHCRSPRDVVIKRNNRCGLGFSIVGGRSEKEGTNLPIFIKYVVPNSPAAVQGGVRCGDEIIAINGRETMSMTHWSVVQALKSAPGSTMLTIMSWPGSVH